MILKKVQICEVYLRDKKNHVLRVFSKYFPRNLHFYKNSFYTHNPNCPTMTCCVNVGIHIDSLPTSFWTNLICYMAKLSMLVCTLDLIFFVKIPYYSRRFFGHFMGFKSP